MTGLSQFHDLLKEHILNFDLAFTGAYLLLITWNMRPLNDESWLWSILSGQSFHKASLGSVFTIAMTPIRWASKWQLSTFTGSSPPPILILRPAPHGTRLQKTLALGTGNLACHSLDAHISHSRWAQAGSSEIGNVQDPLVTQTPFFWGGRLLC